MGTVLAPSIPGGIAEPSDGVLLSGRSELSGALAVRVRAVTLAALVALAFLNGADIVTTHLLLGHRGVEANPLSSLLLASQSLLWVKLGILALLGLKVLNSRPRLGVMGAACFAAGIYATAVLSNLLVLHLAAG
jgi:hypothetical protein